MTTASHGVQVISHDCAKRLIDRAMAHARQNAWHVAVVVLDPWGAVVASGRMDGVPPAILNIACDKAYTAALGKSTRAFYERMSSSPDLAMGLQNRDRLCAWEGGLPIRQGEVLIGAIGVSGAAGPEDVACAQAALEAQGLSH
ncbi:MAG: heme-binding protein [Pseudomonadota bacterium]